MKNIIFNKVKLHGESPVGYEARFSNLKTTHLLSHMIFCLSIQLRSVTYPVYVYILALLPQPGYYIHSLNQFKFRHFPPVIPLKILF